MRARLLAAGAAFDRGDVVFLLALLLVGGGVAMWSPSVAAVVVGLVLLVLAWPSPRKEG